MASITILDHTYTLPVIATEHFRTLQAQVRKHYQLIQTGQRPQPRLLGLLPRVPRALTPAERWHELDVLVQHYDAIIVELRCSTEAYEAFFGQLARGVQQALWQRSAIMQRLEQERLADIQHPETQHDATLQRLGQEDGERLMHGVRLLGQAALLLLQKIALCQAGLARLMEDQDVQRRVLTELTGRLVLHRRAYVRRQRIDQVVQEAARLAQVALHFEEYMRDHLGPLQGMLEQVVRVDSELHGAVADIENLTRHLLQQQSLAALPGGELLDERWLTFLTSSQLKKERLAELWQHLEREDSSLESLDIALATSGVASATSPVLTALGNIRLLVETRLAPLVTVSAPQPVRSERPGSPTSAASLAPRLLERFGITFILLPAGTFQMGADHGYAHEQPAHTVSISSPFYLGRYPVTQRQWEAVMGYNPSHFRGPDRPVEQVSWEEAQQFIQRLNLEEGQERYRLPREAEWEYAARARTTGHYCFGNDVTQLPQYAWYRDNAQDTTHPVGQLQPNAWGLYDMHGNVWEWVQDWYAEDEYQRRVSAGEGLRDPLGPATGEARVLRGGSWVLVAWDVRSVRRNANKPDFRRRDIGFRLLRTVP